jgi:ENTS family enterobactin (siderophore) exporter
VVDYVCEPSRLPSVVGATAGMGIGAVAAFRICRSLPWMPAPGAWRTARAADSPARAGLPATSPWWVLRRALADFSEAQFFGNEWASGAMLLGAVIAYLISPSAFSYGSGLLLAVLTSQAITALAGVTIWRRR